MSFAHPPATPLGLKATCWGKRIPNIHDGLLGISLNITFTYPRYILEIFSVLDIFNSHIPEIVLDLP